MPPVVGIPLCLDGRGRWRRGRDYLYIDYAYARAVERAGGVALLLPLQAPERAPELIARIDALLVPGGDDFAPPDPTAYAADIAFDPAEDRQIAFDRALLRAARAADRPVLGICYGMQLLALEAGGALHHHLPADVPGALEHGAHASDARTHDVAVEAGSRLAGWIGAGAHRVNSRHHQAVADAGSLSIGARAPDGVVEAIEAAEGPVRIGVQWHPETLDGAAGGELMRRFVAEAEDG